MITTFYSYKGGVGRTLALANIACMLAEDDEHPQRVLLWDFDLEAPGLHRLFPPRTPQRYGFVDLVFEYVKSGAIESIRDYIYPSDVANLDILPAGWIDGDYARKLAQIDWLALLEEESRSDSGLFAQLVAQLDGESSEHGYDYVLIDSRTGLNDQAGICTQLLPDYLIVLFRLNEQNIDGLDYVVPILKAKLKDRKGARVPVLPIASAVVSSDSSYVQEMRKLAEATFDCETIETIGFEFDLVIREKLFGRKSDQQSLWPLPTIISDYEKICKIIRDANSEDTRTKMSELRGEIESGDSASASAKLLPLLKRRPALDELWIWLDILVGTKAVDEDIVAPLAEKLATRDGGNPHAYRWLGFQKLGKASPTDGDTIRAARAYFQEAVDRNITSAEAYRVVSKLHAWDNDLQQAITVLRRYLELYPDNARVRLDIAELHTRRGRDFFSSAIEEVAALSGTIPDRAHQLAYLWASLGDMDAAKGFWEQYKAEGDDPEFAHIVRAFMNLFASLNNVEVELVKPEDIDFSKVGGSHAQNWGEYFICAEEYDATRELLEYRNERLARGDAVKVDALLKLAEYLKSPRETSRQSVVDAWGKIGAWTYRELIFYSANRQNSADTALAKSLEIIPELVQQNDVRESQEYRQTIGFWGSIPKERASRSRERSTKGRIGKTRRRRRNKIRNH